MVRWSIAVPANARWRSSEAAFEVQRQFHSQSDRSTVNLAFFVLFAFESHKVHLDGRSGWLYIQRAVQEFTLAARAEDDA